jgi:hypothetical protein
MSAAQTPRKATRRSRKRVAATPEAIRAAILGCGRCSFFLVAYNLLQQDYPDAARATEDGWLVLTGDGRVRRLLVKSYGTPIDADSYYAEGLCPECRRRFVFDAGEEQDVAGRLLLEVVPG